ncbi:MAG: nitroreductase [Burkholderiales bacterium]
MQEHEIVDRAITSRRSVRSFLDTPVPRATVEAILATAARAPSGTNVQPWKVHVLTGARKEELSRRVLAAHDAEYARRKQGLPALHAEEYSYYPVEWFEPYLARRRKIGWDMYGLLGIGKKDHDKMHAQHGHNYTFFGAPVGMIFSIDRRMRQGSWLDYGMFLQSIMIAARGHGLSTCPQQAFAPFHAVIEEVLALPAADMVVCGMALGYEDEKAAVNQLRTERAPLSEFVSFVE